MTVNRAKEIAMEILPDGAVRRRELIRELIATAIQSEVDAAVRASDERFSKVMEMIQAVPELNLNNYNDDDVRELQQAVLNLYKSVEALRLSKLEKESRDAN
jgi:hypothetical protein